MADNYTVKDGANTDLTIRAKDISGAYSPRVIPQVADADVSTANPMPISDAGGSITVDGPLTDTQLRATAVPVSGPLTDTQLRATAVPVSGPLTDTQLRATAVPVSIPASELHLGEVGGNTSVVGITFTLDTSAYAVGDVLAVPTQLTAAFRKTDGTGLLQSIVLNDKDDQGVAMHIVIMDANVSLGTINAAASITDANADNILAIVPVETTDWIDLGGCRIAAIRNLGIPIKSVAGSANLFVGLITRGTPTHTASGITARFGILRD